MGIVTAISIGVFLLVFWRAGVVPSAKSAIATTRDAILAMRDPSLDERARERIVRTIAIRLVVASGSLIMRNLVALVALSPDSCGPLGGITPQAAMLAFMGRWDVILVATVVVTFGLLGGTARMASLNGYSTFDRFVHRIAFLHPGVQIAAADIEDRLFARDLDDREAARRSSSPRCLGRARQSSSRRSALPGSRPISTATCPS